MIVALSGASGFIGQNLIRAIRLKDWEVRVIDRVSFGLDNEAFREKYIAGSDAVINLAGASIAKKWTPAWKEEILTSRIETTRKIANAILTCENAPKVFINTSAIGIYSGSGTHTEESNDFAAGFLAEVCLAWEKEAASTKDVARLVIPRIGMVLGKDGGALEKMAKPFSLGLGGKMGSGDQAVSFIHMHDLVNIFIFLVENNSISGVVNAVAPHPSYNAEFTDKLGKVFGQPSFLTVPAFALRLILGEGAAVVLEGQRVLPEKLLRAGFKFRFPTIQNALVDLFT